MKKDPIRVNRFTEGGRSINLVVSDRGWTAFKYACIEAEIRKITYLLMDDKFTT